MNEKQLKLLDKISLIGIAFSLLLILLPVWRYGFKVGFFLIIFFTIVQVIVYRLLPREDQ